MVAIDRKLNLIIPIERDGVEVAHIVSQPISAAVFQTYYRVIAKTFTQIYADNLSIYGGPRVAAMMLEDVAKATPRAAGESWWEGPDGIENGLIGEIRRLTNVLAPTTEGGWQQIAYADALKREVMTDEEASEVEGALVFFTVNWHMHKPHRRMAILNGAGGMWGWQISSSSLSELRTSLLTSTKQDSTGETATRVSIQS